MSGHGVDLSHFLKSKKIVNGYHPDVKNQANGMGCLTAQFISHMKDGVGNIYVYPPNSKDVCEEYVYEVYLNNNEIQIKVSECYLGKTDVLFEGTPEALHKQFEIKE